MTAHLQQLFGLSHLRRQPALVSACSSHKHKQRRTLKKESILQVMTCRRTVPIERHVRSAKHACSWSRNRRLLRGMLLTSSTACPGTLQTAIRREKAANNSPLLLTGPRITSASTALAAKQQVASAVNQVRIVTHLYTLLLITVVRGVLYTTSGATWSQNSAD
jgi:hypothetical protein